MPAAMAPAQITDYSPSGFMSVVMVPLPIGVEAQLLKSVAKVATSIKR